MTLSGSQQATDKFLWWFGNLPYQHKVFIAGNHDFYFEKNIQLREKYVNAGIIYLCDSDVILNDIKIWGSPWSPEYNNFAFNKKRGDEMSKVWQNIPDDVDILLTHTPPYSILDYEPKEGNLGCRDLLYKVMQIQPKIHAFGHIHFSYGQVNLNSTTYVNCCILDENYKVRNEPIVIEI